MKKLIGLLVVFAVAATMSYAAENVTAQGQAKAKIIQAATLTHVDNAALDFGTLVADADGGTVTLSAAASPTVTDEGVQRVGSGATTDHFTLGGLDSATTYTLSVQSPVTITKAGGGPETMSVAPTLSETTVTNPAQATRDIYVGGVLTIGNNQAAGNYSGNYTVTVTY